MLSAPGVKTTLFLSSFVTSFLLGSYLTLRTTLPGQCAKPELVSNWDPDAYLGVWYELQRDTTIMFETGECVTAEYTLNDNGSIKVTNTEFFGYYDGSSEYGQVSFPGWINNWYPGLLSIADYSVVDSDYTSYAIVYSCVDVLGIAPFEYAWVLVRDQLEEGSAAFDSMLDTVSVVFASKLPDYDYENRL